MSQTKTRIPYSEALKTAQHIVSKLSPYCQRIEIAGSIRREKADIGDIEIVAIPLTETYTTYNLFKEVIAEEIIYPLHDFLDSKVEITKGIKPNAKQKTFNYRRYKVDLFLPQNLNYWGSAIVLRTGSHQFNMWLMSIRCQQVGIKFEGGRLWKAGILLDTPEEGDVFEYLKMDFVPPKERENNNWLRYRK